MNIEECRNEIDAIDSQIITLLNRRASAAKAIGLLKARAGLPIVDRERETGVLRKVRRGNDGLLDSDVIARIYGEILFESRRIQSEVITEIAKKGSIVK